MQSNNPPFYCMTEHCTWAVFTILGQSNTWPRVKRQQGFESSLKETEGGAVVFLIIYIYLLGLIS